MNFNAKDGCQKCTTPGKFSHIGNTTVFPQICQPRRTDALFRANMYKPHQKHDTPLTKLPIDIIEDVVVSDPLHLLELGVTKRLLNGWRTGDLGYKSKWSAAQIMSFSELLVKVKLPSEIHRGVRSLDLIAHWKGLEYRNFLNYIGVVLLKDFLPKKFYEPYLLLFSAVTICSVDAYKCYLDVAHCMFLNFIKRYRTLYGLEFITSNVHNLEHVVEEVRRFGNLSTLSAYSFENCLYTIKKKYVQEQIL